MIPPPKVSVLIPTYNYARYLPAALGSVLGQTFEDYEVIVSDDASTDHSAEVLQRFARRDPRLRVQVQPENLGMVANWNWCLRQARGEYIKFLFADDCLLSPSALEQWVRMLDRNPRASLAVSARRVIDTDGYGVETWDKLQRAGIHPGPAVIARCLRCDRNLIGEPSAVMFRRRLVEPGFDPELKQVVDLDLWFRLLLSGDLVYTPEPLCGFRVHESQQTVHNRAPQTGPIESLLIASRYLEDVAPAGGGLTTFDRQRIRYRCLHYSRKRAPRRADILKLELEQIAAISPPWQLLCWLLHRATRPWQNLAHLFLRRRSRP